eukprot:1146041-Pelagomonas_calceolata.AAC.12
MSSHSFGLKPGFKRVLIKSLDSSKAAIHVITARLDSSKVAAHVITALSRALEPTFNMICEIVETLDVKLSFILVFVQETGMDPNWKALLLSNLGGVSFPLLFKLPVTATGGEHP